MLCMPLVVAAVKLRSVLWLDWGSERLHSGERSHTLSLFFYFLFLKSPFLFPALLWAFGEDRVQDQDAGREEGRDNNFPKELYQCVGSLAPVQPHTNNLTMPPGGGGGTVITQGTNFVHSCSDSNILPAAPPPPHAIRSNWIHGSLPS